MQNFLLAFFTTFITRDIGYRYGFVFASCNLAGAVIVYFFLYESSGITLEAVDQMVSLVMLRYRMYLTFIISQYNDPVMSHLISACNSNKCHFTELQALDQ